MIHRFIKVTDDLYRGSAPDPVDLLNLKNKYNINKIVSLDAVSGHRIIRSAKKLGINHIIIPIDGRILSLINLFRFNLKKLLLEDGPTYVHCAAGKDRTGLVVALIQCMYLGKDPEDAIKEAKSIGLGIGIDPKITKLYEKLIRKCKPNNTEDNNNLDIVSLEREYIGDNRDSALDEGRQGSFAPYLSQTRQNPMDAVYVYINDQSPTRENYHDYKSINEHTYNKDVVPISGLFNNDAGGRGFGPTENYGGFFYD